MARVVRRSAKHTHGRSSTETATSFTMREYTRICYGAAPMRRFHYAWLVAAVTLVVLVTTAGFRSTAGVLIVPMHEEFGWSRGTISSAASLGLLMFGLSAPFAA